MEGGRWDRQEGEGGEAGSQAQWRKLQSTGKKGISEIGGGLWPLCFSALPGPEFCSVSAFCYPTTSLWQNCLVKHAAHECFTKHPFKTLLQFFQLLTRGFSLPLQNLCSSSSTSITIPAQVIFLRFLAFLSCAFLVLMALYGSGDPFSLGAAVPAPVSYSPAAVQNRTGTSSRADLENDTSLTVAGWRELLQLLPEQLVENLSAAWAYGKNHQMAVAVLGLFTCLLAMFLAGRIRWVCSSPLLHLKTALCWQAPAPSWLGEPRGIPSMANVVLGGTVLVFWVASQLDWGSRACSGSVPWFIQFKLELERMKSSLCSSVSWWGVQLIHLGT